MRGNEGFLCLLDPPNCSEILFLVSKTHLYTINSNDWKASLTLTCAFHVAVVLLKALKLMVHPKHWKLGIGEVV